MESTIVYRNESSKGKLFGALFLPAIPLIAFVGVVCYLELESILILAIIPYIAIWLVIFQVILSRVYEVMVIYRDRIMFVNPYSEKVLHLNSVSSIYYRPGGGLSFHDPSGSVYKPGFKFEMENHYLERTFQVISEFIGFDEEHIRDSKTFCLVNGRSRGAYA